MPEKLELMATAPATLSSIVEANAFTMEGRGDVTARFTSIFHATRDNAQNESDADHTEQTEVEKAFSK
jgi:hypothetical protein